MNSLMDSITPGEIAAGSLERRIDELDRRVAYIERKLLKHLPEDRDTPSPYDLSRMPWYKKKPRR